MQYDIFLRLGAAPPIFPENYPFTLTMLMEDGSFKEQTIRRHSDLDLRKAVSVKLHRPSVIEQLAAEIASELGIRNADRTVGLKTLLYHLHGKGLLKVDGQPSPAAKQDWLDTKMDNLGIRYQVSRGAVRRWFEDPAKNPTCDDVLTHNEILTVKRVPGGRVIVLPTGHTLAYTTAQAIYWEMCGNQYSYVPRQPTVGEYRGRGKIHHTSRHRLTITRELVTIGCQNVERRAVDDLAQREGWSTRPAY